MRLVLPGQDSHVSEVSEVSGVSDVSDADLAALYAYRCGPWLRANMVASADGAGVLGGLSEGLSSPGDRRVFGVLRALADVVMAGAGTVRAENYKPARDRREWRFARAGRTVTPPIAVISASLDVDPGAVLFTGAPADARTIVITCERSPADRRRALAEVADVIIAGDSVVDLKLAVLALRERGLVRMLCEGGPRLLADLVATGLLDELCLTIGPLLAGPGATRIVSGPPLAQERPMSLRHVLEEDGYLFCRYTVGSA
jgi:riboflavin biosynthesis pyrimidine reductase